MSGQSNNTQENQQDRKTCWICSDEEYCKFPVCYEQETTETIKREEEEEGESD